MNPFFPSLWLISSGPISLTILDMDAMLLGMQAILYFQYFVSIACFNLGYRYNHFCLKKKYHFFFRF